MNTVDDDDESVGDESTNLQNAKKMRAEKRLNENFQTNQITGIIPTTSAKKIDMNKMKSFADPEFQNQLGSDKQDD